MAVHDNEFLVRVRYKHLGELKGGKLSQPRRGGKVTEIIPETETLH